MRLRTATASAQAAGCVSLDPAFRKGDIDAPAHPAPYRSEGRFIPVAERAYLPGIHFLEIAHKDELGIFVVVEQTFKRLQSRMGILARQQCLLRISMIGRASGRERVCQYV